MSDLSLCSQVHFKDTDFKGLCDYLVLAVKVNFMSHPHVLRPAALASPRKVINTNYHVLLQT